MHFKKRGISSFCQAALLWLPLFQCYGQSNAAPATLVRIAAWTTAGERIERIWVVASSQNGKEKYAGNGRDVELSVPTGEYVLQVEAPGFQSKRQMLKAYQPAVFRSVALPVARLHGQAVSRLNGTVLNYAGDMRDLRIRLMGLYGDDLRESVPGAQGAFSFPVDEGAYLLLVVADLNKEIALFDSQPLVIPLGKEQTVTVDLKGKHGTVVPLAMFHLPSSGLAEAAEGGRCGPVCVDGSRKK